MKANRTEYGGCQVLARPKLAVAPPQRRQSRIADNPKCRPHRRLSYFPIYSVWLSRFLRRYPAGSLVSNRSTVSIVNHKRVTLITLDARVRSLVPALGEVSHAVRQPG